MSKFDQIRRKAIQQLSKTRHDTSVNGNIIGNSNKNSFTIDDDDDVDDNNHNDHNHNDCNQNHHNQNNNISYNSINNHNHYFEQKENNKSNSDDHITSIIYNTEELQQILSKHEYVDDSFNYLLSEFQINRTPSATTSSNASNHSSSHSQTHHNNNGAINNTTPTAPRQTLTESKIEYMRQTVLQYLICKDMEVKEHIEHALMTLFRFNEAEKAAIDARKKDDETDALTAITSDTLSSISSYFTSFT